jgi:hypothetical protein
VLDTHICGKVIQLLRIGSLFDLNDQVN